VATWKDLVDQHGPLVWRLAYRLLGNEHDAADCYQTVFVQVFEALKQQAIHNWPGFLTRLTSMRAIDLLRTRYRHRQSDSQTALGEAQSSIADDPQRIAQCRELIERLREALSQLPLEQAQAFCLRYFEQMSNQEVAAQMATNVNHIAVLLHRAREALRERFDESRTQID